jgi:hypothetical protein
MSRINRCVLTAAAVIVAGCAHTAMTSMPAPDLRGRAFHSVLVFAQIADLGLRQTMESRFVALTSDSSWWRDSAGVTVPTHTMVPSYQVFFPGRDYTSDQITATLRRYGIDATLVITPGERGSTEGFVPPTYTTRCSSFSIAYGCQQTTTTTIGGFSYAKPWQEFSAKLYDASTGEEEWIATATSSGNVFAHTSDLVQSMADKTMERLIADGIIGRPNSPLPFVVGVGDSTYRPPVISEHCRPVRGYAIPARGVDDAVATARGQEGNSGNVVRVDSTASSGALRTFYITAFRCPRPGN